jgi:hypothetical protein
LRAGGVALRLFTIIVLFVVANMIPHAALAYESTYDAVVAGKRCYEGYEQQLECTYKVGDSLELTIIAIGMPDASILFNKSDFSGDYYLKFGLLHGCLTVVRKNIPPDFAFIQPLNGKVYRSWPDCQGAM